MFVSCSGSDATDDSPGEEAGVDQATDLGIDFNTGQEPDAGTQAPDSDPGDTVTIQPDSGTQPDRGETEPDAGSQPDLAEADTNSQPDRRPPENDAGRPDTTQAPRDGLPVLLSLHMEAKTARHCDDGILPQNCTDDESWIDHMDGINEMLDVLDSVGLKGTFQHQIQWLQRLEESATGRAITRRMLDTGHEIALHHHGWGHGDPDGYSNNPDAEGDLFLGTMDDYIDIVHDWEERWDYQLVTIEGTELNFWDNQPEWLYRTSDDQNNEHLVPLDDPDNICGYADGSGKPAWQVVALPSVPTVGPEFSMVGHTYYGRGKLGQTACHEVYAAHILRRTQEILDDGPASDDAINLVLHPTQDYANPNLTGVYDQFFSDIMDLDGVVGMTVRDYMCERAGACE